MHTHVPTMHGLLLRGSVEIQVRSNGKMADAGNHAGADAGDGVVL